LTDSISYPLEVPPVLLSRILLLLWSITAIFICIEIENRQMECGIHVEDSKLHNPMPLAQRRGDNNSFFSDNGRELVFWVNLCKGITVDIPPIP
jgi:hypothetical protein